MGRGKSPETLRIIETCQKILKAHNPMTLRQVFYQLVSRQIIENTEARYKAVSKILISARQEKIVPWEWIEDRLRIPRAVNMWRDLPDFAETAVRSYRRDVWPGQSAYIEVWLEKDALSGIFERQLDGYGVTLNVGRGYDGWTSIHNAADRFGSGEGGTILYFGDFDPSGENMFESLIERLAFFDCQPKLIKCALTLDDIERYNLPPAPAKKTDTRAAHFIAKYGNRTVELDALPLDVLKGRVIEEVESRLDLGALEHIREIEDTERKKLLDSMKSMREEG